MQAKSSFVETLGGIRKGAFLELVNQMLTEVVAACATHVADGELKVTLAFKANGEGQLVLKPKVASKIPHRHVGDAIFYATSEGELERSDPKQPDFDFDSLKGTKQ